MADVDELLQVLADCPVNAQRIMLVGHNPGFEDLLTYLAKGPIKVQEDGKVLPTATLARLEMPDNWQSLPQGSAKLLQLTRAKTLPKKFPYPMPNSHELRDRPAYYYTQSSVIPYRINNGRLEILLIRSSKNKHWVVPKGIADPGHTLQDSAAKEAWEEAGVEGDVANEALGTYDYAKWGATCTVSVYPMKVTRQLPDNEWQERHRNRQWVAAGEAADLLKQPELEPMVLTLEKLVTTE
jgi:phosphohistidine phosphatase